MEVLSSSVRVRIESIPFQTNKENCRIGIFFSGGIDSVVLAALANVHVPLNEPIELLTVCFDSKSGFRSPDRLAAEASWEELRRISPTREWRFIEINVDYSEVAQHTTEIQNIIQVFKNC